MSPRTTPAPSMLSALRRLFLTVAILLPALFPGIGCAGKGPPDVMGAYRLEDGRLVSIRMSVGKTLRCRLYASGESRRLYPDRNLAYFAGPGFSGKSPVELTVQFHVDAAGRATGLSWREKDKQGLSGRRLGLEERVVFDSDGVTLSGRLNLPPGSGPHPAVVLVHGSGSDAATDYYFNGDFLAAHGIATLTYDKRGTGQSGGAFTFDFQQLADDVVAAVEHLQSRPEIDEQRIGLSGYSQGAWVAPLAASLSHQVRYVIVHYGLIASPAEEARVETRNTLRGRGVDDASLEQLDELTLAAVGVVAGGFREGWDEFGRLKKKYKHEPWMKQLSGTVVGKFVSYPRWLVKVIGPRTAPPGMPWYYDSAQTLESLSIPMVWFLAGEDQSAPIELTLPQLRRLQASGKPYEVVVFPGADHTMLLFSEESGERTYTGYVPGYHRREVESARRLSGLGLPGPETAGNLRPGRCGPLPGTTR